ncbi:MAG TPA: helix-hairpin-helix domain-containing protein [Segetibacter sp.]
MNYWWRNIVKDYLTFSKKDRSGIFIAFLLLTVIFLVSRYYPVKTTVISKDAFQQELAHLKITIDSSRTGNRFTTDEYPNDYSQPKNDSYSNVKANLFAFDPNTLDAEGWKKLGVRDRTISTIQKLLSKGFRFRQPGDIQKIYGLRNDEAQRLLPYVRIAEKEASNKTNNNNAAEEITARKIVVPKIIDINSADTGKFISLPGIGSKLAMRIINFREKLGGFSSVNQLAETYGIPDSTFQLIKPLLQCNNPDLKKININFAELNELRVHPYLKWNIANAIVNYRKQHGNYKTVEDLHKIDIMTDDLFNKIAPYLII